MKLLVVLFFSAMSLSAFAGSNMDAIVGAGEDCQVQKAVNCFSVSELSDVVNAITAVNADALTIEQNMFAADYNPATEDDAFYQAKQSCDMALGFLQWKLKECQPRGI